jgi:hypothetical protein
MTSGSAIDEPTSRRRETSTRACLSRAAKRLNVCNWPMALEKCRAGHNHIDAQPVSPQWVSLGVDASVIF